VDDIVAGTARRISSDLEEDLLNTLRQVTLYVLALAFSLGCNASETITKASGGSIKTDLGYGISVNKGSSLEREWITIHDDAIPADISGNTGTTTIYKKGGQYSRGSYQYKAVSTIVAKEPLVAIEVRFLNFDIWGDHTKSLSATEVVDIAKNAAKEFEWIWNVYSENEVAAHYASIAYTAQVRTRIGKVIKSDLRIVLEQARLFSKEITEGDLEPDPEKE
jgi:hypothetical protein